MTARDIRLSINQILENTEDSTLLEAYYVILQNLVKVQQNQVAGYDINGQPMTRDEFELKIKEISGNIEKGNFISHEDLKKTLLQA